MNRANVTVRAVVLAAAVSIVVGLLISWFAWPAKNLAPRDLPVVVAGPAPVAGTLADKLRAAEPGAFDVSTVADAAAADQKLRDRQAYAAFVVDASGVSLHTASGASPTVAALLSAAATQIGPAGQAITVVDVVPGSPDDPRGTGFAAGYLPQVLAGIIAGVLFTLLIASAYARLLGLVLAAAFVGLVGAGVLQIMGVLNGAYLATAGAAALVALATSATVAGLAAVIGRAGIALGVLVVFAFGNPISGVAAAPQLLPKPWGEVGQFLPPGAGATLLRSAAFFDGAGGGAALWTLIAWSVVGLALVSIGRRSNHLTRAEGRAAPSPATSTASATAD
ncbi:MAG TPA: hypothetical protein VKB69_07865 [Micromonosporaceae bacterium]|nr:hypothetical protein [Micromonosporaceae bacterium]